MILSGSDISPLVHGAYQAKLEDDYTYFYRFDDRSISYYANNPMWGPRALHSASVTLEFKTDASSLSLLYKSDIICSYDSVEAYINGMAYDIRYMRELPQSGRLDFTFPDGDKFITIYFPIDARMGIGSIEINSEIVEPIKYDGSILFIGDSITHGFGPLRSSMSYVNILNRTLSREILNQGIGGYIYEGGAVRDMRDYTPDMIVTALGTNGFDAPDYEKKLIDFFERFDTVYKDIPTLIITPLWRGDIGENLSILKNDAEMIMNLSQGYSYIESVNGFDLVPHLPEYFLDLLHPNALGAEIYANNLIKHMKEIKYI